MDLFLVTLNHGAAVVILVAIFGVSMASFALQRGAKQLQEFQQSEWLWWQDLQELGFEIHLATGDTWRSLGRFEPTIWREMRENSVLSIANPELSERLTLTWRDIKGGLADDQHAHCMVDWTRLDGAWQVKLLNDSVWQLNMKNDRWHRVTSPQHLVFEATNLIHAALDTHLREIRATPEET